MEPVLIKIELSCSGGQPCAFCSYLSIASPPSLLPTMMLAVERLGPSSILTLRICGPSCTDTEPVKVQSMCDHILLGLKQDDVHLGCKQTAQDYKAAQTNGNAHGRRLHL